MPGAPPPGAGGIAIGKGPSGSSGRSRRSGETDWEATIHRLESELASLTSGAGTGGDDESFQARRALLEARIETAYRHWMTASEEGKP